MSLARLTEQEIYDALDYNWWTDVQPRGDGTAFWQQAMIYFQDTIGNYHAYGSTGTCPENPDRSIDSTTREYYIKNGLMWDTARWLANGQCAGAITNARPKEYQPMPIYFK